MRVPYIWLPSRLPQDRDFNTMPAELRRLFSRVVAVMLLTVAWSSASPTSGAERARVIVIDGQFGDWKGVKFSDRKGWQDGLAEGPRYLYLHFRQPEARILQAAGSDVVLLLDTDGKASTGKKIFGMGADIEWNFGSRSGKTFPGGVARGATPADLGLVIAPTVGSRRIEIALSTPDGRGGVPTFGKKVRGAITTPLGANGLADEHQKFNYRRGKNRVEEPPLIELERPEGTLRVINYNIERDGLFASSRHAAYRRIFRAIEPDIVGFQEIFVNPIAGAGGLLDQWIPLDTGRWHTAAAGADAGIASRFPIDSTWLVTPGVDAYLVDTRATLGTRALVVVVSLKCCDDPEQIRKTQIDEILHFWRDAITPGGAVSLPADTPILMIGDMNLVGDPTEVSALREGIPFSQTGGGPFDPDWGRGPLLDVLPRQTDNPMAYTWRSDGNTGGFAPGRLDYLFLTPSVLDVARAFALHSSSMSNKRLREHGLKRSDTAVASDHLPIVVDVTSR